MKMLSVKKVECEKNSECLIANRIKFILQHPEHFRSLEDFTVTDLETGELLFQRLNGNVTYIERDFAKVLFS